MTSACADWWEAAQGWISVAGTPLFVCGASAAFLGFIGAVVGVAGLFERQHSKAVPVVGLLLRLMGLCLFLIILARVGG